MRGLRTCAPEMCGRHARQTCAPPSGGQPEKTIPSRRRACRGPAHAKSRERDQTGLDTSRIRTRGRRKKALVMSTVDSHTNKEVPFTHYVIAVFDERQSADQAVAALRANGWSPDDVLFATASADASEPDASQQSHDPGTLADEPSAAERLFTEEGSIRSNTPLRVSAATASFTCVRRRRTRSNRSTRFSRSITRTRSNEWGAGHERICLRREGRRAPCKRRREEEVSRGREDSASGGADSRASPGCWARNRSRPVDPQARPATHDIQRAPTGWCWYRSVPAKSWRRCSVL